MKKAIDYEFDTVCSENNIDLSETINLYCIFWSYFYCLFVTERDFERYVIRWTKTKPDISFREFMDLETNTI